MRRLLALTVLLVSALAPGTASAAGPETDAVESDLLARVNAARGPGLEPLDAHPQLSAAAHAQAAWLAGMSFEQQSTLSAATAHCGGAGCPEARAAAAGWPDAQAAMGEITKFGTRGTDPVAANDAAIAMWESSSHHSEQLHRASWRSAGAAVVGDVAVVVFAERCAVDGCVTGTAPVALGPLRPSLGSAGARAPARRTPAATTTAGTGTTAAGLPAARTGCTPYGRIRVLRGAARRRAVEVRLTCRSPGRRYTAKLRDGRRARTVPLRGARTLVRVPASRRTRWLDVSIAAGKTSFGRVRVRVPGS